MASGSGKCNLIKLHSAPKSTNNVIVGVDALSTAIHKVLSTSSRLISLIDILKTLGPPQCRSNSVVLDGPAPELEPIKCSPGQPTNWLRFLTDSDWWARKPFLSLLLSARALARQDFVCPFILQ